ncbi:50S ribosomal protein L23 [Candidatus Parcubacteria bacterium]|nr:50S ribosomal protein L23 [Candidatus Parcubacteria bacterium]MBI4098981.1 50S ribosomal protein L23 [Candidatus Parcubacteria bacterium]MBI4385550.1 50S ribosomal protein L23 [Candidatus Parcubacteria bacterium]
MAIFSRRKKPASETGTVESAAETPRKRGSALAAAVLRGAPATEKAVAGEARGEYTFRIRSEATKVQVKRAVEEQYGVAVKAVRVVNMPGKVRKRGRIQGWRPGFRKAIVTIAKGQKLELVRA